MPRADTVLSVLRVAFLVTGIGLTARAWTEPGWQLWALFLGGLALGGFLAVNDEIGRLRHRGR